MTDKDKVASIDIHKKVLMVVVGSREGEAIGPQSELERRRFGTMTSELGRLSAWLPERGVKEAVMESTAGYWKPVWMELEPSMCLHLAQASPTVLPRGGRTTSVTPSACGGGLVTPMIPIRSGPPQTPGLGGS